MASLLKKLQQIQHHRSQLIRCQRGVVQRRLLSFCSLPGSARSAKRNRNCSRKPANGTTGTPAICWLIPSFPLTPRPVALLVHLLFHTMEAVLDQSPDSKPVYNDKKVMIPPRIISNQCPLRDIEEPMPTLVCKLKNHIFRNVLVMRWQFYNLKIVQWKQKVICGI
jgi:hypothetical protein